MSNDDLVNRFMEVLFSGKDLKRLKDVLDKNLLFEGPFARYTSAIEYINELESDPPFDWSFDIIHRFSVDHQTCIHYTFSKPGLTTEMIQIFEIGNSAIKRIQLFFDPEAFNAS